MCLYDRTVCFILLQAEAKPSTRSRALRGVLRPPPLGLLLFSDPEAFSPTLISHLIVIKFSLLQIKAGLTLSGAALEHAVPQLRGRRCFRCDFRGRLSRAKRS